MDQDQIQVGNISDSQAVAIGAGTHATINQYTEIIVRLDNIEEMPPAPGHQQPSQPAGRCPAATSH